MIRHCFVNIWSTYFFLKFHSCFSNLTWREAKQVCEHEGQQLGDGLASQYNIKHEMYKDVINSTWHKFGNIHYINIDVSHFMLSYN